MKCLPPSLPSCSDLPMHWDQWCCRVIRETNLCQDMRWFQRCCETCRDIYAKKMLKEKWMTKCTFPPDNFPFSKYSTLLIIKYNILLENKLMELFYSERENAKCGQMSLSISPLLPTSNYTLQDTDCSFYILGSTFEYEQYKKDVNLFKKYLNLMHLSK